MWTVQVINVFQKVALLLALITALRYFKFTQRCFEYNETRFARTSSNRSRISESDNLFRLTLICELNWKLIKTMGYLGSRMSDIVPLVAICSYCSKFFNELSADIYLRHFPFQAFNYLITKILWSRLCMEWMIFKVSFINITKLKGKLMGTIALKLIYAKSRCRHFGWNIKMVFIEGAHIAQWLVLFGKGLSSVDESNKSRRYCLGIKSHISHQGYLDAKA
jgi:hypothetical protein